MSLIINHDHPKYRKQYRALGKNKFNGAFYYSKEICRNIIPRVRTDRNWITINIPNVGCDHAIVFIHNNKHPQKYEWLSKFHDLVLVCGVPETCDKVAHLGRAVYLPLSVDVAYVEQFRASEKSRDTAYVGRRSKATWGILPDGIDYLCGLKRQELLPEIAKYRKVYAVGRCAIEAMILGCEVLPFDTRFPDAERWQIVDNSDAAVILQRLLDEIDG